MTENKKKQKIIIQCLCTHPKMTHIVLTKGNQTGTAPLDWSLFIYKSCFLKARFKKNIFNVLKKPLSNDSSEKRGHSNLLIFSVSTFSYLQCFKPKNMSFWVLLITKVKFQILVHFSSHFSLCKLFFVIIQPAQKNVQKIKIFKNIFQGQRFLSQIEGETVKEQHN